MRLPFFAVVTTHKPNQFRLDYDGFACWYTHVSTLQRLFGKSNQRQIKYSCNNRVIDILG
jgi:hypothetical protein